MYQLEADQVHRFEQEVSDYAPTRIEDLRLGDIILVNGKNSVVTELIYEYGIPKVGAIVDYKVRDFDVCRETMYKIKTENRRWTND